MSRIIFTYWLIGCFLNGCAIGYHQHRCQLDEIKSFDVLAAIAAWPALLVAVPFIYNDPPHGCNR